MGSDGLSLSILVPPSPAESSRRAPYFCSLKHHLPRGKTTKKGNIGTPVLWNLWSFGWQCPEPGSCDRPAYFYPRRRVVPPNLQTTNPNRQFGYVEGCFSKKRKRNEGPSGSFLRSLFANPNPGFGTAQFRCSPQVPRLHRCMSQPLRRR